MKKKKYLWISFLVICIVAVMTAVEIGRKYASAIIQATVVSEIFKLEDISGCSIKSLADYGDIHIKLETPIISDEEINTHIEKTLKEYNKDELTDVFVKEVFEFESVEKYKENLMEELLEEKKIELLIEARNAVLDEIINTSNFELDVDTVSQYSLEIVDGYEMEAYIYGLSLEEYIKEVLDVSYDDFFDICYEEGERIIKTYLIMGAIYNIEFKDESLEGENVYIQYQELENKVYSLFIEVETGF